MTVEEGKRGLKIDQKIYTLPSLSVVTLETLQRQMGQHCDRLIEGQLIVQKKEIKSFLRTKIIEETIQKPLSFEESSEELEAILRDYDALMATVKRYKYDYQSLLQGLAEDIGKMLNYYLLNLKEKEQKRQDNERQEYQKSDPNPQILSLLTIMEVELLKSAKATIYPLVLILNKLDLISEILEKINFEPSPFLTKALGQINSQKDLHQLTTEINAIRPHHQAEHQHDVVLNLEPQIRPFKTTLKVLFSKISQVDRELTRAIGEIQNLVHWLEIQQLNNIEPDLESEELTELLLTKKLNQARLKSYLKQGQSVRYQLLFDNSFEKEVKIIIDISFILDVFIKQGLQRLALTLFPAYLAWLPPPASGLVNWCLTNFEMLSESKLQHLKDVNQPGELPSSVKIVVEEIIGESELFVEHLPQGVSLEMVKIEAGSFLMGSLEGDRSEQPQHSVTITDFFYLSKYPITQEQFKAVMEHNPSKFKNNQRNPVDNINWNDAQAFCQKLSQLTGKKYQLPSEAQWEYSCSAGATTKYHFGDNENDLGDYAWYGDNTHGTTHPVGLKKPNAWGLYDLYGNVWEWCEDVWHHHYEGAPTDGSSWLDQHRSSRRILRGGSWHSDSLSCRSANRYRSESDHRNSRYGFRVVLSDF